MAKTKELVGIEDTYEPAKKAEVVAALIAAGYPLKAGALAKTSRAFDIDYRLIRAWHVEYVDRKSPEVVMGVVEETKGDLRDFLVNELHEITNLMVSTKTDASYRDLVGGFGTLFDRLQALDQLPKELMDLSPDLRELAALCKDLDLDIRDVIRTMIHRLRQRAQNNDKITVIDPST